MTGNEYAERFVAAVDRILRTKDYFEEQSKRRALRIPVNEERGDCVACGMRDGIEGTNERYGMHLCRACLEHRGLIASADASGQIPRPGSRCERCGGRLPRCHCRADMDEL